MAEITQDMTLRQALECAEARAIEANEKNAAKNIKGFIFGKNYKKFSQELKNKIIFKKSSNLKEALKLLFYDINKDHSIKKTILFSPAAASFDSFKNFEDRGL